MDFTRELGDLSVGDNNCLGRDSMSQKRGARPFAAHPRPPDDMEQYPMIFAIILAGRSMVRKTRTISRSLLALFKLCLGSETNNKQ